VASTIVPPELCMMRPRSLALNNALSGRAHKCNQGFASSHKPTVTPDHHWNTCVGTGASIAAPLAVGAARLRSAIDVERMPEIPTVNPGAAHVIWVCFARKVALFIIQLRAQLCAIATPTHPTFLQAEKLVFLA